MPSSILITCNDSVSSRAALDFFIRIASSKDDTLITLVHILRKPSASEELMGKKFIQEQPSRFKAVLEKARNLLVENGFNKDNIVTELVTEPYSTVSEGIIELCKKKKYDMVVIGRKRMSKAEEFVLGDVSMKLIRSVEDTAILVVKVE